MQSSPSTLARLAVRFYGHSHTQNGGGIAAAELRYGVDSVHARLEAVIFLEMAHSMQDWLGSAAASQIVHKAAVTRAILPFYGTASPPTAANGRCIAASLISSRILLEPQHVIPLPVHLLLRENSSGTEDAIW